MERRDCALECPELVGRGPTPEKVHVERCRRALGGTNKQNRQVDSGDRTKRQHERQLWSLATWREEKVASSNL